ncbi:MAG: cobalamin-independent methionine synthase II family protein [Gammaproteobacteria bacterium]
MQRSTDRILTTHTGSLPRPPDLVAMLLARAAGQPVEAARLAERVRSAVGEMVAQQISAGLDVVNDGEQGKVSFEAYRKERLSGFELREVAPASAPGIMEAREFPEFFARMWFRNRTGPESAPEGFRREFCTGPVAWKNFQEVERDLGNLRAAASGAPATETFMTAVSPATYAPQDDYYHNESDYLGALAAAMRREYQAIVEAGFVLQIDAPDLTTMYRLEDIGFPEYLRRLHLYVDAINEAVRGLPLDRIRVHVCWGADEAPHHRDVPLKDILGELLRLTPHGMSIPGANGRHAHEWQVWRDVKLPPDKIIIPGVIDSTTNIIEHPEAVAERIEHYAQVLGRERVIAGVDCGFDTVADRAQVDSRIVWAKLRALAQGAEIASRRLWGR